MSVNSGRDSIDSLTSPTSTPTLEAQRYNALRPESSKRPLPHHRKSSTASSIGGALRTSQSAGTDVELSQNAISTLLQPPIVRTGLVPHTSLPTSAAYRAPTSRDIPPVTLTNIPHVDNSVFKPYLSQVGSIYETFQRAKAEREEDARLLLRRQSSYGKDDASSSLSERDKFKPVRPPHSRRGSSVSSLSSPTDASQQRRRSSGGHQKKILHSLTPLATIPPVYFEPDFRLENPRTFDIVSERSDIIQAPSAPFPSSGNNLNNPNIAAPGRKALATNAILQEKLSWYMDTVEMHLISSISTASTSFFAALGSLKELQKQALDSVQRIRSLRSKLKRLDDNMASRGLHVVNMKRRRANLQQLRLAVDQLRDIVQRLSQASEYLKSNDYENAIKTVEESENLIAGESVKDEPQIPSAEADSTKLLDLRGIRALDGVMNEIDGLRYQIGQGFEKQFLDTLLGDLRTHAESVPVNDTLQRWGSSMQRARGEHNRKPSVIQSYINITKQFRSALQADVNGLTRSNSLMAATTAFREAVIRQMKTVIRKHLPSSNDDDNESIMSASTQSSRARSTQEKSQILARNLRSLDPQDAYELLSLTYAAVGETLRRLSTQVKVLLDITSGIGSPPNSAGPRSPFRSPIRSPSIGSVDGYLAAGSNASRAISPGAVQREINQALDMSSLLGQAVDIAQAQMTKILKVRGDSTVTLPLSDFLRYFTLNRLFADECEAISGRGGAALKSVVNNHIRDFVSKFGQQQQQDLVESMDRDQWDAQELGEEENKCLSRLLEGFHKDAEDWIKDSRLWEVNETVNGGLSNGRPATPSSRKDVIIDEQKFILPNSASAVLRGINGFEHLISGIPSLTQEISSALLDYLRTFNSRASQLILGAGATRKAGLRNITTKHLALASQALSFLIALMPYIREYVRRHIQSFGTLGLEFDKVKRLFQDHQIAIHEKLVDIMSGRATSHVASLRKIDWEVEQGEVNDYMERLGKETSTLHRVLSKHLPETTVQLIMNPIFTNYRENLGKAFADVTISSQAGKTRLVRDAEYLRMRLSKLNGSGDVGDYIVQIANSKSILVRPETAKALNGEEGSSAESGRSSSQNERPPETEQIEERETKAS